MIIEKGKDKADVNNPEQQINTTVEQHEINILSCTLQRVSILFAQVTEKKLQPDYY